MINKYCIAELLHSVHPRPGIVVQAWVRTRRDSRDFSFFELNDGSCLANIQVVADNGITGYADIPRMTTGAAIVVSGDLIPSPGKGQQWEIRASAL